MKSELVYIIFILIFFNFEVKAQDLTPPDAPIIDSVTVQWDNPINVNGDIFITWKKSDSTDVRSYYIKYLNEALGTYKFLDSVDANTNTYLDTKAVTNPHYAQTYVVQAVDSSNNTSSHSLPHQTVRIFPVQKDENCKITVELTWNTYQGWNEGIEYFDLYSVEDQTHHYLGRLSSSQESYSYQIDENQNSYEYYLRVKSKSGRTSTSNKIPFVPNIPSKPKYIEAQYATVDGNKIKLSFKVDNTAELNSYTLEKRTNAEPVFCNIKTFNHTTDSILEFIDTDVNVSQNQYFYKLYLQNDCGNIIDSSRMLSPILLRGEVDKKQYYQQLFWTKYEDELNNDKNYRLYRFTETEDEKLIYSATNLYHLDNLKKQDFGSFVGDFCYYVVLDNEEDFETEPIRSNIICLSQAASVIFPNAFAPNSYIEGNTIFKPSFTFISAKNYYFAVYDRWGTRIFETNNYKEGWTGKKNNLTYNNGVYIYYLEYYSEGKRHLRTGKFNLID